MAPEDLCSAFINNRGFFLILPAGNPSPTALRGPGPAPRGGWAPFRPHSGPIQGPGRAKLFCFPPSIMCQHHSRADRASPWDGLAGSVALRGASVDLYSPQRPGDAPIMPLYIEKRRAERPWCATILRHNIAIHSAASRDADLECRREEYSGVELRGRVMRMNPIASQRLALQRPPDQWVRFSGISLHW